MLVSIAAAPPGRVNGPAGAAGAGTQVTTIVAPMFSWMKQMNW